MYVGFVCLGVNYVFCNAYNSDNWQCADVSSYLTSRKVNKAL